MTEKAYLGDGVYVNAVNGILELTTEDGIRTTNTIILELEVLGNLNAFVDGIVKQNTEEYLGNEGHPYSREDVEEIGQ